MKRFLSIFVILLLAAGGCTTTTTTTSTEDDPSDSNMGESIETAPASVYGDPAQAVPGQNWVLESIQVNGQNVSIPTRAQAALQFRQSGEVNGRGGINAFFGSYSIDSQGRLVWGPGQLAVTRMAGPRELIEFEDTFLGAIRRADSAFVNDDGQLILSGSGIRMQFARG